ncbi:DUF3592 domain-containing protein [Aquabacterium sp. A7-Y]|uniref:DUF3592 domain-containing protein n=1 Tax=Aquabacterium sp. A7-Y TaxID=1349605 RepID=UPI00223CEF4B|nr:DUF3592 domain-containing protein [Aquabacterium sp. A7-Y]MCW7540756.1 DUF3592 domain-containing protein [Aquabacterium sp. A7-Y]
MTSNSWWSAAAVLVIVLGLAFYMAHLSYRDEQLRRHGVAATGRVISVNQTGSWSGNNPEVALALEVARPGEPPYPHTLTLVVAVVHTPAVQPGQVLRLKIDPKRRDRLVIDEPWAAHKD